MKAGDIGPSAKRSLKIVPTIFRMEEDCESVRLADGGGFICTVRADGKSAQRLHPKLRKYLRGVFEANGR